MNPGPSRHLGDTTMATVSKASTKFGEVYAVQRFEAHDHTQKTYAAAGVFPKRGCVEVTGWTETFYWGQKFTIDGTVETATLLFATSEYAILREDGSGTVIARKWRDGDLSVASEPEDWLDGSLAPIERTDAICNIEDLCAAVCGLQIAGVDDALKLARKNLEARVAEALTQLVK